MPPVRGIAAWLIALGSACSASAQAAPLTLAEAVRESLREGPEAKIARLEADRADDAVGEAWSAYWPHAGISSQAGYSNRRDEKLRAVDGSGRERRYGLSTLGSDQGWFNFYVEQLVFDLGTWRRLERTELAAEAAEVTRDHQRDATALEVLERYTEVLRLAERERLAGARRAQASELDARAALLLSAGRTVPAVRERVALELASADLDVVTRREDHAHARRALALALGRNGDAARALVLDPASVEPPAAVEAADDQAVRATPELRLLDLRQRMAEAELAATRAERYPRLGLRGGYSHYGTQRFDNFDDQVHVGVDMSVPLFDGHKTRYAVAGATKAAEIARLRYQSALETKRARLRELAQQVAAAATRAEILARQSVIAAEQLRLADLSLKAERGSLDGAMAARATYARDAGAAVDARYEHARAWARHERELGRLGAAILGSDG